MSTARRARSANSAVTLSPGRTASFLAFMCYKVSQTFYLNAHRNFVKKKPSLPSRSRKQKRTSANSNESLADFFCTHSETAYEHTPQERPFRTRNYPESTQRGNERKNHESIDSVKRNSCSSTIQPQQKCEKKDYLIHRVSAFRLRCSLRTGDHVDSGKSHEQGTGILCGGRAAERQCVGGRRL